GRRTEARLITEEHHLLLIASDDGDQLRTLRVLAPRTATTQTNTGITAADDDGHAGLLVDHSREIVGLLTLPIVRDDQLLGQHATASEIGSRTSRAGWFQGAGAAALDLRRLDYIEQISGIKV